MKKILFGLGIIFSLQLISMQKPKVDPSDLKALLATVPQLPPRTHVSSFLVSSVVQRVATVITLETVARDIQEGIKTKALAQQIC